MGAIYSPIRLDLLTNNTSLVSNLKVHLTAAKETAGEDGGRA